MQKLAILDNVSHWRNSRATVKEVSNNDRLFPEGRERQRIVSRRYWQSLNRTVRLTFQTR
jgi:hypothetical protein